MDRTSHQRGTFLRRSGWVLVAAAAVMATSGCAPAGSNGDYPAYSSDTEMAERSDAVVVGDILSDRREAILGFDYRVVSIEVLTDAKSLYEPGDLIEVKLLTGSVSEPGPDLDVDGRYVLFLETYDSVPASLLNPWQAYYEVQDGTVVPDPDNDLTLGPELQQALGIS
ncbi:hypothetical protein GSU68_19170 (plasmid) [Rathayibacter sp. VKM Ac-2759]|uniref:Lipoprotein n=1 Tax=Rathayibacter rubneri TaxID=2950106 RepID=A0A9X2IT17_9MICO|nr:MULTISPECIES: hypothetical protein [Rathayibacter]MCM6761189.1 hypothetical protein [Rathayibacter rubneri]QHC68819.1 hypothetical protein GSU68_19170 [Rathayibacter sp. VKM Ac-2759]